MSANNFVLGVIHAVNTSIISREELKFYSLVLQATETRVSYGHVGLMAHVYLQNFQKAFTFDEQFPKLYSIPPDRNHYICYRSNLISG